MLAATAQERAIFPSEQVWGMAAWKEDASSRVRFGRDPLSSPMSRVRESQPWESVVWNPSQKQVSEQKGNNAGNLKRWDS